MSKDVVNSLENRLAARPKHLQRIMDLKHQGHLVIAGPHPAIDSNEPGKAGFSGSLIIAEFDSLQHAQQWADDDPYNIAGVYASLTVKPFKQVLP